jgi:SAM-dependent methyltransferase
MTELSIPQGAKTIPGNAASAFVDSWQTYQKVVAANHMFHREKPLILASFFKPSSAPARYPFLIVDAATLAPVLVQRPLRLYKGIDLSETALALARKNLAALSCPVEPTHSDIVAALSSEARVYGVIYSGFAVHHLPLENKAEVFRQAARCLKEGGVVLLADVMPEEGESLGLYHSRYCGWLRKTFTALDASELDLVCDHIKTYDLPEPRSVLMQQAAAAGLGKTYEIAAYNWHKALCFTRQ